MPIALYDIVMLAVLALAVLWGAARGMAWQVASLCSVVVSGAVAIHGSPALAPVIGQQEPWNRIVAMAILYVITAGAIWIVFRLVSNIIDRVQLKEFDRQLGATFGLVKGAMYCVIITFFAVTLSETGRQGVLQSRSGDLIARGIRYADPIMPADIRSYLGKYIAEFDAKLHAPPADTGQSPAAANAAPPTQPASSIAPSTNVPAQGVSAAPAAESGGEAAKKAGK